jgi:hypothetical protein
MALRHSRGKPRRHVAVTFQAPLSDLWWRSGRLSVSGPKPDQYEEHHTGPQADNMRGSETAVVPGDPGKHRNGYQDDHHQY